MKLRAVNEKYRIVTEQRQHFESYSCLQDEHLLSRESLSPRALFIHSISERWFLKAISSRWYHLNECVSSLTSRSVLYAPGDGETWWQVRGYRATCTCRESVAFRGWELNLWSRAIHHRKPQSLSTDTRIPTKTFAPRAPPGCRRVDKRRETMRRTLNSR